MSFFMISSSCTPNSCKVDKKSRSIDLSMSKNTWHTSNEPTLKVMTRGSLYEKFTSSFSLNIIGVTEYFLCKLYTPKPISFHTSLAYLLRALLDSLFKHGPLYMEWIICTLSSSQAFYLSTWVVAIRGKLLFFLPSSLQLPSPTRFPKYPFSQQLFNPFFQMSAISTAIPDIFMKYTPLSGVLVWIPHSKKPPNIMFSLHSYDDLYEAYSHVGSSKWKKQPPYGP